MLPQSTHLYLPTKLLTYLSINQTIHILSIYVSTNLSICSPFVIYQPICQPISLSICLAVHLFVSASSVVAAVTRSEPLPPSLTATFFPAGVHEWASDSLILMPLGLFFFLLLNFVRLSPPQLLPFKSGQVSNDMNYCKVEMFFVP